MTLSTESIFPTAAKSLIGYMYEPDALKSAIKDGTLATAFSDEIQECGADFFFQNYQSTVERTSALVTLADVFAAIATVDGEDIQFQMSNRNIEHIIGDKTLGLMYGHPLFTDIELVNTDLDATYLLGGGRNRSQAIYDFCRAVGMSHEGAIAQQIRATVVTFSGDNADANKSLYIIASNDARKMLPIEKAAVKLTATIGVHYSDTLGIIQGVKSGKVDISTGLGLIANNELADKFEGFSLTPQAWITFAKGFVSALKDSKSELYYVDRTPAMSPKGDKPKVGFTYAKLLAPSAIEDLSDVFRDALETALGIVTLPSDIVRNGVPLLIRAASEAVDGFELDDFYPDLLPLKVKAVKAVKTVKVTSNTALTLEQCDAVLRGDVACAASMKISQVMAIKKAIIQQGGYPALAYTALDAKQILEGNEPITEQQAASIIAGTEPNDSGLSPAQLRTIAKSLEQAVTVTPSL